MRIKFDGFSIIRQIKTNQCCKALKNLIEAARALHALCSRLLRALQQNRVQRRGAFHLGKKPGNFGGSKSGISDW